MLLDVRTYRCKPGTIAAHLSAGDREAKRAKLWADEDWLAYTRKSAELGALESQENKLMNPVSFCPLNAKR